MPQMAPLNWLMLMFFFSMIFIMFNIMNYYSFMYPPKISKFTKKSNLLFWKW